MGASPPKSVRVSVSNTRVCTVPACCRPQGQADSTTWAQLAVQVCMRVFDTPRAVRCVWQRARVPTCVRVLPQSNPHPQVDTTPPAVAITRQPQGHCRGANATLGNTTSSSGSSSSYPPACVPISSDVRVVISFGDAGPEGDVRAYSCR
jgi:hypothetical protein